MGADGHVFIYDYDKIAEEVGEEAIQKLTNSVVYIHELSGKRYLTEYHGDNMYFCGSDWSDCFGWCSDHDKTQDWYISKEEFEYAWSIVRKHEITEWEVWT